MSGLDEQIRGYTADRAGGIRDADAAALVTRATAKPVPGRGWPRHIVNLTAALVLAAIVIAGGIVLETQLRGLRHSNSVATGNGPLPTVPNRHGEFDQSKPGRFDCRALPRQDWHAVGAATPVPGDANDGDLSLTAAGTAP